MISQQRPGESLATRLEDLEYTPITLRELLIIDKRIVVQKRNGLTGKLVYEIDKSAIEIAKGFYEEVVFNELR